MTAMSPRLRHFRFGPVLWAFACALMLRALLPAGVMLAANGANGAVFEICSGSGPIEAVLDADGRIKPADHAPAGGQSGHQPGACPWAGGHAFTATDTPQAPVPTRRVWATSSVVVPPREVRTLHLRAPPPPSHAPPVLSA
jgi:hypothetical protein